MKKSKHRNAGSSLEDFLKEDGTYDAATLIAVKRVIAWQLEKAMAERALSKTEMAALMDKADHADFLA